MKVWWRRDGLKSKIIVRRSIMHAAGITLIYYFVLIDYKHPRAVKR
jgi:hypothetical protein